jgi:hypothetical protein
MRVPHIVICGLSGYTKFSKLCHKRQGLKEIIEQKNMCSNFMYNFVWNISHTKNNSATYFDKRAYVLI